MLIDFLIKNMSSNVIVVLINKINKSLAQLKLKTLIY